MKAKKAPGVANGRTQRSLKWRLRQCS